MRRHRDAERAGVWGNFQLAANRTVRRLLSLPGQPQFGGVAFPIHGWRDNAGRVHLVCLRRGQRGQLKPLTVALWSADVEKLLKGNHFSIRNFSPDPTLSDAAILRMIEKGAPWEDAIRVSEPKDTRHSRRKDPDGGSGSGD